MKKQYLIRVMDDGVILCLDHGATAQFELGFTFDDWKHFVNQVQAAGNKVLEVLHQG